MKRPTLFLVSVFCLLASSSMAAEVTYENAIKPLLKKHCVRCHARFFPQAKLRLISLKYILKGGMSGQVVVPGKPDESLLIQGLELPVTEKRHMPPAPNPALSAEEIALFRQWITDGAK